MSWMCGSILFLVSVAGWTGCAASVGVAPRDGASEAISGSGGGTGGNGPGTGGVTGAGGGVTGGTGGVLGGIGGRGGLGVVGSGGAGAAMGMGGNGGNGTGRGGAGGGPAVDPCGTALFCEDFESYATGPAPAGNWTTVINGGAISIDTAQARSGTKSVKFTTQAQAGAKTAFIRLASRTVFPVAGNLFYGRMMFRLEAAPTTSVHWTFIQGGGLVPGQTYHALYRYGGQQPVLQGTTFLGTQFMANYETPDSYGGVGPSSDCYRQANKTVAPVGKWSCVEWRFDGPNNDMRLWLDGAPLGDLTVTGTGQGCVNQPATFPWTAPTFDNIELGWESYQTDTARTLWIDDVVISKTQIGCP